MQISIYIHNLSIMFITARAWVSSKNMKENMSRVSKLGSNVFSIDINNSIFAGPITHGLVSPSPARLPLGEAALPACVYLVLSTFTDCQQMIPHTQQSLNYWVLVVADSHWNLHSWIYVDWIPLKAIIIFYI